MITGGNNNKETLNVIDISYGLVIKYNNKKVKFIINSREFALSMHRGFPKLLEYCSAEKEIFICKDFLSISSGYI